MFKKKCTLNRHYWSITHAIATTFTALSKQEGLERVMDFEGIDIRNKRRFASTIYQVRGVIIFDAKKFRFRCELTHDSTLGGICTNRLSSIFLSSENCDEEAEIRFVSEAYLWRMISSVEFRLKDAVERSSFAEYLLSVNQP